jgi:nitronate monooxygenase
MNNTTINWKNEVTNMLSTQYPVIQAPMFGVSTSAMAAAASKAGCLGSLPLGDLPADDCIAAIRATKQLTDKKFAVNIFVNEIPEITDLLRTQYTETKKFIEKLATDHDISVVLPEIDTLKINSYHDQIDALITENCTIVSFTFGNLDQPSIKKLKNNGTILIGTCTSVDEALILEKSGIDIICVQGIEAGGHRGSFTSENIPEIGGFSLLSQVYDTVSIPIVYAGGIYDAKTLLAAKTLGAQGFQVGSLLLGSAESALKDFEKERLRNAKENDIILTKSFSGRYARGIQNAFMKAIDSTQYILPYPYQNKLTAELRKAAKLKGNADFVSIWAGQSLNSFSQESTGNILLNLINEVENHPLQ